MLRTAQNMTDYHARALESFGIVRSFAKHQKPEESLEKMADGLWNLTVIEALSDQQFLPSYGFPIGVHRLQVLDKDEKTGRVREEDQYRLERNGVLAIGEYVPGSRLLAGGKDVAISGGADTIRQALRAGVVDTLAISTAPVVLGAGKRLFDGFTEDLDLSIVRVHQSPYAVHTIYDVLKP